MDISKEEAACLHPGWVGRSDTERVSERDLECPIQPERERGERERERDWLREIM